MGAGVVMMTWALLAYGNWRFDLGVQAERNSWLSKENAALTEANARIQTLQAQARTQEHVYGEALAIADTLYQEGLQHEKTKFNRVVADLRTGDLRLYVPVARAGDGGGGGSGAAAAATGERDGEARAELSGAAAEFLVGLASEANEVVEQLTACQAVVIADRSGQQ